MSQLLPSFDVASPDWPPRLAAYLERQWGRPVRLSALRRFPAGMSWITIGVTAEVGGGKEASDEDALDLILRIGDPHGLLAPYRAEPEFLVLSALAAQPGLPIPRVYAYCDDLTVIGAPFLVTQRIEGDTPQPWKGAGAERGDAADRSLGHDFAEALGAIHAFDWTRSPLAAWGAGLQPADVARRQVQTWARHAGVPGAQAPPQMHYAMRWLEAKAPVASRITVVHGDYRVGNFLQKAGRITAILDWELVHLGDPHEDLAWAGLRTFAAGTARIGGLIEREEFEARHHARTGLIIQPRVLRYYEVLGQFKMAALLVGAVRRHESGRAHDVRMAAMGFQLAPTLLELNRLIAEA